MKKTLLKNACAIIAACATIFLLGSCSQTEFDGRTDTVYSLETPSVSAKAYPGVNVVSWKPVTGASSYKVIVYEEGAFKKDVTDEIKGNCYADIQLTNGKTYTYYVEAVSGSSPSKSNGDNFDDIFDDARGVYAKNNRGEASVKAIVPPMSTKALELTAYEGGYDGKNTKTVSENDEWVVRPSNIVVEVANGKVYVNFPMKAYLKYTVKYYDNDLIHDKNVNNGTDLENVNVSDLYANNALGQTSFQIASAGSYQIAIVAKAYNTNYVDSDDVIYSELITIDSLKLDSETTDEKAEYVLADYKFKANADKTVRVSFTPAKKDGEYVPTEWYTVYRRVKGEYTNTKINAVKESNDTTNNTKYYVDDTVPDVTKEYVYTIVVTNGKEYGQKAEATLTKKTKSDISNISIIPELAGEKINWMVTVTGIANNEDVELTAYSLAMSSERSSSVEVLAQEIIDSTAKQKKDLKITTLGNTDSKVYLVESQKPESGLIYLLVQAKSKSDSYKAVNYIGKFPNSSSNGSNEQGPGQNVTPGSDENEPGQGGDYPGPDEGDFEQGDGGLQEPNENDFSN